MIDHKLICTFNSTARAWHRHPTFIKIFWISLYHKGVLLSRADLWEVHPSSSSFSFTLPFSNDQKCGRHVLAHGELFSSTVGIGRVSYWPMQLETKQNFISSTMNRKVSLCSKLFKPFFPESLKAKIEKSCPEWFLLMADSIHDFKTPLIFF